MRARHAAVAVLTLATIAIACDKEDDDAQQGRAIVSLAMLKPVDQVKVKVTCKNDTATIDVSPWTAFVDSTKGTLEFVLDPSSDADSMVIADKGGGNWVFANNPPYASKKGGANGKGNGLKQGTKIGDKSSYSISLTCQRNATSPKIPIVIDPDVIIVNDGTLYQSERE